MAITIINNNNNNNRKSIGFIPHVSDDCI